MAVSVLEVIVTGDSSKLTGALGQGAASAKTFEKSVGSVGTTAKTALGAAVPLGAAAAGVAIGVFAKRSVDAAISFDRSFTQIAALTDTTSRHVAEMRDRVLTLAGATAQAPNDLAKAMYFLASAGLNAEQQQQALDAAAKGAAVGLGDAGDIARITANALNAFAGSGLTATDVVDTLVAAVREGTAEPNEFADALGRVLPIADKAGISFQQVAASLATMSNAGLDVNEGVTALRGILQSLVAPTNQTQKALESIGLTTDDVVASMQQEGLIATLRTLDQAAKDNTSSTGEYNIVLRNLVPNVRALTGVFNLTGQQAQKVDDIFQAVADSSGDLSKAFSITAESSAFRIKQALNDLSITGQELASKILPALATGLGFVADHAQTLLEVLVGYAGVRFVQGLLAQIGAESVVAATGVGALGVAAGATSGALELLQIRGATWAATETGLLVPANEALAVSQTAAAASTGLVSRALTLLNGPIGSNLPQIYALTKGFQDASKEFQIFRSQGALSAAAFGLQTGTQFLGFHLDFGTSAADAQHFNDQLDQIRIALIATGLTADQQSKVFQDAMTAVGGSVNPDNVDAFAQAIADSTQTVLDQAKADQQAADQAKALAAAQQASREQTDAWQASMDKLTAKVQGLSIIGIDANSFLADFRKNLESADDPMTAVETALGDITAATAKWRDETSGNLTGVGDVLSKLAGRANITASQIIAAFDRTAEQTRNFAADLKTIGSTGGSAGRELANALLQMGPSAAGFASTIAGASEDMRKRMVASFGDVLAAGQNGASKLQSVLVPVLKDIRGLLEAVASKFGIELTDNADKTNRHLDSTQRKLQALGEGRYSIDLYVNDSQATASLSQLQSKLQGIQARYSIDVGVHTHPQSPWPDEALRDHLEVPLRRMGFLKIGGRWTLPIDVGAHANVSGFGMGLVPDSGGHHVGGWDTINGALKNFRKLIADAQSPMYAKRWQHDMLAELKKQGGSEFQRTLFKQAIRAAREVTTTHEARDAATAFHDAIRHFEMHRADSHNRPKDWTPPPWYDLASKGRTSIPVGASRERTKLDVRLDRKHFDEDLAYETTYRGWY